MDNKLKVEVLYDGRKKNMIVAYILWLLGGSFGIQYLYLKRPEYCVILILLFISQGFSGMILGTPVLTFIFLGLVLAGVIHTYFVVVDTNDRIRKECEILMDSGK